MITMVRARPTNTVVDHLVADTNIVEVTKEAVNILTWKLDTITMKRATTNPSLIPKSKLSRTSYQTRIISAPKSSGSKK